MTNHFRNLSQETLVLTLGNITSLLLGLVGSILIARALGADARGLYAWVFTVQGFGCQVAGLVTYHTARSFAAHSTQGQFPAWIGACAVFAIVGSALFALPILVYALLTPLGQTHSLLLITAFIGVPILAFTTPLTAFVHAQKRQAATLFSMVALRLILLLGTLVLLGLGILTPQTLTFANIGAALGVLIFTLIILRVFSAPLPAFLPSRTMLHSLMQHIGPAWLAILGLYALPKIGVLVLAANGSLATTGHFSVALSLFEALLITPSMATAVLIGHLAQNATSQQARRKITLFMLGGTTLGATLAAVLSPWVIPFLFGTAFYSAVLPFQILMPCLVLAALHQAWFSRLLHAQSTTALMLPSAAGCGMVWLCAYSWVEAFGAFGAAMATFMGYGVLVLTTYTLKRSH